MVLLCSKELGGGFFLRIMSCVHLLAVRILCTHALIQEFYRAT